MQKLLWLLALMSLMLLGCGLKTSGVNNIGGDTYSVSSDGLNDSEAKGLALGQAEAHCDASGQKVLVTQLRKRHKVRYFYDVTFKCLPEGDPQLQNPQYETSKTVN
ncbi:MAG TPA: hypothetical protein VFM76_07415 [Methylophaga sp.]|nr:hypothetical protein [Methylophaga sp.]